MARLTDFVTYAHAQAHCSPAALWALMDGDRSRLNIAWECVDRHATDPARVALNVVRTAGEDERITFAELSQWAARFAHALSSRGIGAGDRVAVMLEPGFAFYVAVFGAMKRGAIAVPLFTLFGPDGLRLRIDDCRPRLLVTNAERAPIAAGVPGLELMLAEEFRAALRDFPDRYEPTTAPDDMAAYQYTSGTTRDLPAAVKHTHRSVVVLMAAALYATGVRPGERFFCPSSPAWGHGLWHGTIGPLALGIETGAFAGKFDPLSLLQALERQQITNLSAAATHYRMLRNSGAAGRFRYAIRKLTFTGEPIDSETAEFAQRTFGVPVCSFYGTTEVGVVLADYPGAPDHQVRPGALGKPMPGLRLEVQDPAGQPCAADQIGEIKVWRRDRWFPTKDRGWVDRDGYFFHAGRADDVIISAGWTIGAPEVEDALLKHPDVKEAAVIGVPDALRGQVIKAFIVAARPGDEAFTQELQDLVRSRLSQHEYPRQVVFVGELPKTPAGKVNRKVLRDREAAAAKETPDVR